MLMLMLGCSMRTWHWRSISSMWIVFSGYGFPSKHLQCPQGTGLRILQHVALQHFFQIIIFKGKSKHSSTALDGRTFPVAIAEHLAILLPLVQNSVLISINGNISLVRSINQFHGKVDNSVTNFWNSNKPVITWTLGRLAFTALGHFTP